ncbi:MAG: PKD domain-containing protein [Caldilineaceae bacterium]|nr:PKD domain-containing protein [Caldilineaceae bacterium]
MLSITFGTFVGLFMGLRAYTGTASGASVNALPHVATTDPSCRTNATVFAAMQGWHGLNNHNIFQRAPYRSLDERTIARQVDLAKQLCIDALVLDWFGPSLSEQSEGDRAYIDQVGQKLVAAAGDGLQVALMYDMKTLAAIPRPPADPSQRSQYYTQQVIADITYAQEQYFAADSYLQIQEQPVLFIFPDPHFAVDWSVVRNSLDRSLLMIAKAIMVPTDRSPTDQFQCQPEFDGFYGWVRPTNGLWDGSDIGETYMRTFYAVADETADPCHDKLFIGGVWPGFDDEAAHWQATPPRIIPRNCGNTWQRLWAVADAEEAAYVMIITLNDFEEGTDIEYGAVNLLVPNPSPILPGRSISLSANLADCTGVTYQWALGDGQRVTAPTVVKRYPQAGAYTVLVTATYPTATVTASTTVLVSITAWQETFAPLHPTWSQPSARWTLSNTGGILTENNPAANFGKVESEVIRTNVEDYPILYVIPEAIDADASLTVQLLNKGESALGATGAVTVANVITGLTQSAPDLVAINYAQLLDWTGFQCFTINLWINGEGKSVRIRELALTSRNSTRPIVVDPVNPIFLPLILR